MCPKCCHLSFSGYVFILKEDFLERYLKGSQMMFEFLQLMLLLQCSKRHCDAVEVDERILINQLYWQPWRATSTIWRLHHDVDPGKDKHPIDLGDNFSAMLAMDQATGSISGKWNIHLNTKKVSMASRLISRERWHWRKSNLEMVSRLDIPWGGGAKPCKWAIFGDHLRGWKTSQRYQQTRLTGLWIL